MPSRDDYVSAKDIDPNYQDILISPKVAQQFREHATLKKSRVGYDKNSSVLTVEEISIQLPKNGKRLEAKLCEVLFPQGRPLKKKLDRDEIRTRWDKDNPESYELRVVSDAAWRLNNRVKVATGKKQPLLKPARMEVAVNRFYLS